MSFHSDDLSGVIFLLFLLVLLAALIFICVYFSGEFHPFKRRVYGTYVDTAHCQRIFGLVGERVINGSYSGWMQSLWKHSEGKFFILSVDEINTPHISLVTSNQAINFLHQHADENHAKMLINEWKIKSY